METDVGTTIQELKARHAEEIEKMKKEHDELLSASNQEVFSKACRHTCQHTQTAIVKGFAQLLHELYVRGAKQMEEEILASQRAAAETKGAAAEEGQEKESEA